MVSHLFYYQLALLALLWLFVMLPLSCQFLAQNTHPYTSPEKGRKALLERLCQGMQRIEADTDHPPVPPPDDPWHCRPFLKQPHQAIAI
jgi:hypothetical protein